MLAIYIDAGHSTNGNPRRGWIITDDSGSFIDFVDEGYEGKAALSRAGYAEYPPTPRIEVAAKVYRELKRDAERRVNIIRKRSL